MSKPKASYLGNDATTVRQTLTIADVIGTAGSEAPNNATNSVNIHLGNSASGETYTKSAMMFSPPGIMSIPLPPGSIDGSGNFNAASTSLNAAQALAFVNNDQYVVFATRDTRTQFATGNLKAGETSVYAPGSSARTTYKLDGSVNHITQTSDGSQVYLQVSPTALSFFAPWGRLVFDATGFHLATSSGATFDLGAMNGPLAGSYASLTAGTVSIPASTVLLGTPGLSGYQQAVYPITGPLVAPTPLPATGTTALATASTSVYVGS